MRKWKLIVFFYLCVFEKLIVFLLLIHEISNTYFSCNFVWTQKYVAFLINIHAPQENRAGRLCCSVQNYIDIMLHNPTSCIIRWTIFAGNDIHDRYCDKKSSFLRFPLFLVFFLSIYLLFTLETHALNRSLISERRDIMQCVYFYSTHWIKDLIAVQILDLDRAMSSFLRLSELRR